MLLDWFAKWPGRRHLHSQLDALGYGLLRRYDSEVKKLVGSACFEELDAIWNEVAMEHLCAGGRADSRRRRFPSAHRYRSSMLDALATNYAGPAYSACESKLQTAFNEPVSGSNTRYGQLNSELEAAKAIDGLHIDTPLALVNVSSFDHIFEQAASRRGFYLKKKWWRKSFNNGVVECRIRVDKGRRTTWSFSIPIFIELEADGVIYSNQGLQMISPAFKTYSLYGSPRSAALGVQFIVDVLVAIGTSIDENQNSIQP